MTNDQVMTAFYDPDDEKEKTDENTIEEQLEITPGVNVSLALSSQSADIPGTFLPALRREVVKTTKELILGGAEISAVVVEVISATSLQINFYQAYGKYVKKQIIPILTFYEAKDKARKFVHNSKWDQDLKSQALKEISELTRNK